MVSTYGDGRLKSKLDPQQLPPTVISQEVSLTFVIVYFHFNVLPQGQQVRIQPVIVRQIAEAST